VVVETSWRQLRRGATAGNSPAVMQAACSGQGLQKQGLEGRLWIPQMGNAQLKEQPSTLELIRLSTKRTVGMWHVSTRFLLRGFVANGLRCLLQLGFRYQSILSPRMVRPCRRRLLDTLRQARSGG
jgi:hypothetical protein